VLLHRALLDGAHRRPDAPALRWVERDRVLSYAEAVEGMDRTAGALWSLGVRRGDRVAVFAHNGMDYLLAMFGAWRIGAIAALVNVAYADRLDYYIGDCDPLVLIYTGDYHATIERFRGGAAFAGVRHHVCFDGPRPGSLAWGELLASGAPAPDVDVAESDPAHLSYTSGTSGDPKGACLAHEPTARATRCIAERLRVGPEDVSFGPTALSSSYQLVANLMPALHMGATVCVTGTWQATSGWEDLDRIGATVLAANPPVLTDVLAESRRRGGAPRRLRIGLSGGGPVPPALKRAWRDELHLTLAESFGQSELGGFFGLGGTEPLPDRLLDACGRPLPDKEVRIFDDDGREVPTGALGEIVLRGGFMAGYWRRPEKTAEALRGGWLHSGDVGFIDAEGYLHMRGRVSERVTVAGRHWYPRDIEEALLSHPAVVLAAVVGLPDEALGQRPVGFVTVSGEAPSPDALVEVVAARVGECPQAFVVQVVDDMPMTPTGKISKAQLIDRASERS
jgi:long-chain acyl-CoA synthetase